MKSYFVLMQADSLYFLILKCLKEVHKLDPFLLFLFWLFFPLVHFNLDYNPTIFLPILKRGVGNPLQRF